MSLVELVDRRYIAMFTGHRPESLFGSYDPKIPSNNRLIWRLKEVIVDAIENKGIKVFISGMAQGIDLWAARIVLKLKKTDYPDIRLVAAVPCEGQSRKWPKEGKKQWQDVIDQCDEVVYVSEEMYFDGCMDLRNEWMVNHSGLCIAVYKGGSGGTKKTMLYAYQKNVPVWMLKPHSLKVQKGIDERGGH